MDLHVKAPFIWRKVVMGRRVTCLHSFIQAASPTYPVVLLVEIGTFRFEDKNNYEYEI